MHAVTVLGEALIDIVAPVAGEAEEYVGGSPANVAIGLARLGHRTRLATHIGRDARGDRIAELLRAEHVDLSPGSRDASRTPTAAARLDGAGIATYEFDLSWELKPEQVGLLAGQHLHTGSIAVTLQPGAASVARVVAATRPTSTISYDPNARPSLMGDPGGARRVIEAMIGLADLVKASEEDIEWLYPGQALEQVLAGWAELGPAVCAATRGGREVMVLVGGRVACRHPRPTTVVDTVGAGDSFMAGFISGLLDAQLLGGLDARERLRSADLDQIAVAVDRALDCAAITVSRAGANPPTRQELAIDG